MVIESLVLVPVKFEGALGENVSINNSASAWIVAASLMALQT